MTVVLILTCMAQAQRPGGSDTVRELSRIDTNRAVDLQLIRGGGTNNEVLQAIQKQIGEDFRDLQSLNNKMMATAWGQQELDYKFISRTTAEMSKKAARLRSNLALPKSEEKEKSVKVPAEISTAAELKAQLLSLDHSVMSFVNNPIFQKTTVIDMKLANQAKIDLEAVIEMSKQLKKASAKLEKH